MIIKITMRDYRYRLVSTELKMIQHCSIMTWLAWYSNLYWSSAFLHVPFSCMFSLSDFRWGFVAQRSWKCSDEPNVTSVTDWSGSHNISLEHQQTRYQIPTSLPNLWTQSRFLSHGESGRRVSPSSELVEERTGLRLLQYITSEGF
jgi:hypothetical protein